MSTTTQPDLADQVYDHMAANCNNDRISGFTVHRGADGTAAVTFRAGILDAQAAVLRQKLLPWAERLRAAGFVVEAVYGEGHDYPSWLKVTSRIEIHPTDTSPEAAPQ